MESTGLLLDCTYVLCTPGVGGGGGRRAFLLLMGIVRATVEIVPVHFVIIEAKNITKFLTICTLSA